MKINRRKFITLTGAAGGGLVLGFNWTQAIAEPKPGSKLEVSINAYIKYSTDGAITILSPNPEIGQGIKTSMPMIVAEELDVDWNKVSIEQAPLDTNNYTRQVAGGSGSIRSGWNALREAGATVRQLFIESAADVWQVEPDSCETNVGSVLHRASGKTVKYEELIDVAIARKLPEKINLKEKQDYSLLGSRIKNCDARAIATGQMKYGIDTVRAGMKYAAIIHPPSFGATLKSYDSSELQKLFPSVAVYDFDNNIAIVGSSTWEVFSAKKAIKITWESNNNENSDKLKEEMVRQLDSNKLTKLVNKGNTAKAFSAADQILEAEYYSPILPHATMEPMNFFAHVTDEKIELYGPIQTPENTRRAVAKKLQVSESKITIGLTRMGGGFGRRLKGDFVIEAVMISKLSGFPINLVWTREDDMTAGVYKPSTLHRYKASVKNGELTGWEVTGIGLVGKRVLDKINFPVGAISNIQLRTGNVKSKVTIGPWRAPNHNFLAFSEQTFLDEIATNLDKDPIEMRLQMLSDVKWSKYDVKRLQTVILKVREMSEWENRGDRHLGFAAYYSYHSYVAMVAEVSVTDGKITVEDYFAAVDCGQVINLSGAEAQIEGAINDALGHSLFGEMLINNGAATANNFHQYQLGRINTAPKNITISFIESEYEPTGLGEPGMPPTPPALVNAIYQATGKRYYELPLKNHGII
ncbi:MAG: molybdopterin cofactor-binding domain-containing protein [Pseudomonadales bacterium]